MTLRSLPPESSGQPVARKRPASLGAWIRAWRSVVLYPNDTLARPPLPAEGEPIPADLDLHCPECDYSITGLCEWQCPECGKRFTVQRAWTHKIESDPEYQLRYRFAPEDILCTVGIAVLVAATLPAVWWVFTSSRFGPGGVYRSHGQAMKLTALLPGGAIGYILRGNASLRGILLLAALWFLASWVAAWMTL